MKIYVSFGQIHRHVIDGIVFDKDCLCEIECESMAHGRDITFSVFGDEWFTTYEAGDIMDWPQEYMSRGIIKLKDSTQ